MESPEYYDEPSTPNHDPIECVADEDESIAFAYVPTPLHQSVTLRDDEVTPKYNTPYIPRQPAPASRPSFASTIVSESIPPYLNSAIPPPHSPPVAAYESSVRPDLCAKYVQSQGWHTFPDGMSVKEVSRTKSMRTSLALENPAWIALRSQLYTSPRVPVKREDRWQSARIFCAYHHATLAATLTIQNAAPFWASRVPAVQEWIDRHKDDRFVELRSFVADEAFRTQYRRDQQSLPRIGLPLLLSVMQHLQEKEDVAYVLFDCSPNSVGYYTNLFQHVELIGSQGGYQYCVLRLRRTMDALTETRRKLTAHPTTTSVGSQNHRSYHHAKQLPREYRPRHPLSNRENRVDPFHDGKHANHGNHMKHVNRANHPANHLANHPANQNRTNHPANHPNYYANHANDGQERYQRHGSQWRAPRNNHQGHQGRQGMPQSRVEKQPESESVVTMVAKQRHTKRARDDLEDDQTHDYQRESRQRLR